MITDAFLQWLASAISTVMATIPAWNWQLGYCNVPPPAPAAWDDYYTCAAVDFLAQYDHFLPIHDGAFPIVIFSFTGVAGFLAMRVALVIVNVIRGSGA